MSRHNGIPLLDESRSFSLIFRGAKTLDLMVDGFGDREKILYVLNSIVTEYSRAKVKVGNEVLLLRYVWNDVDRVSYTCFTHISLLPIQAWESVSQMNSCKILNSSSFNDTSCFTPIL